MHNMLMLWRNFDDKAFVEGSSFFPFINDTSPGTELVTHAVRYGTHGPIEHIACMRNN